MFRTKICGVTTPEDARVAVELGVEMIGLNFYSQSPRCVTLQQAEAIAEVAPNTTGVFVNATAETINSLAQSIGLDWVQLHGDEPAELLADIRPDLPIIRVHCLGKLGMQAIAEDLEACRVAGRSPNAVLIDATVPGEYGGTGKTVDWPALVGYSEFLGDLPLILAGGLQAGNVAQAIAAVRPTAVDTASGVEASPGVKDRSKMQAFLDAARTAFLS